MANSLKVAVIGAGVIGASIAYRLARSGAKVSVLDMAASPGAGVTGKAFGWINLINGDPAEHRKFNLWRHGIEEYAAIETEIPEAFDGARKGSLLWLDTPEQTENLARDHMRGGAQAELIDHAAIMKLEPNLRRAPQCGIYSKGDIALNPAHLALTFIDRARDAGASWHSAKKVKTVAMQGENVSGVLVDDELIDADVVVVAAGSNTEALVSPLGIKLGLEISPAILLRYSAEGPLVNHIVCCSEVEVRQSNDLAVICAADHSGEASEDSLQITGANQLDAMRKMFTVAGALTLKNASIGNRPMFKDGLPRVGFATGVGGLYIAVGHPGVILAPLIGKLACEEIVRGSRSPLLG